MAALKLKQQCQLRFQSNLISETVTKLSNINALDTAEFFSENYFTPGMKELCRKGFQRLAGMPNSDGFFRLTESMGGGKTHNLLAFGLLAKDQASRSKILKEENLQDLNSSFGNARLLTFEGYQTPQNGIWGFLAEQINSPHASNAIATYLGNSFSAPGAEVWTKMLLGPNGENIPTVILLDELPVYFESIGSIAINASNLASITAVALTNLFTAVATSLPTVVLIMTDLNSSSWQNGSSAVTSILQTIETLQNQASRTANAIMPVQLNSDDIYHILRKRIFTNVGTVSQIQEVQKEFQMNATLLSKTSASPFIVSEATEYSKQLITSYPFHPAFKGLLGRFQANTGFQQTRGVLRMMHAIAFNIFNNPNVDPWLIAPECMDLNDTNILSSITGANQYLISAISEDIASNGNGVAECGARSEIGPISPCS